MNAKIEALKAGESMKLGGTATCWTTVERSGDGSRIRFVRHTPNSFYVFSDTQK